MLEDARAILGVLTWYTGEDQDFKKAQEARQTCSGTGKLMRQFCNLALGAAALTEMDTYAATRRKMTFFFEKLTTVLKTCDAEKVTAQLQASTLSTLSVDNADQAKDTFVALSRGLLVIRTELAGILTAAPKEFARVHQTEVKQVTEHLQVGLLALCTLYGRVAGTYASAVFDIIAGSTGSSEQEVADLKTKVSEQIKKARSVLGLFKFSENVERICTKEVVSQPFASSSFVLLFVYGSVVVAGVSFSCHMPLVLARRPLEI